MRGTGGTVLGFIVICVVAAAVVTAVLLVRLSDSPDDSPRSNRTSWTDDHGRLCTQVDPPGEAIALDCDFPSPTTGG